MVYIAIGLIVSAITGLLWGRFAVTGSGDQPTDESFDCLLIVVAVFVLTVLAAVYVASL